MLHHFGIFVCDEVGQNDLELHQNLDHFDLLINI